MKSQEMLKELEDYIAIMTDYYITVLLEEQTDYNRAYIKGKLDTIRDIRKKLKKFNKEVAKVK